MLRSYICLHAYHAHMLTMNIIIDLILRTWTHLVGDHSWSFMTKWTYLVGIKVWQLKLGNDICFHDYHMVRYFDHICIFKEKELIYLSSSLTYLLTHVWCDLYWYMPIYILDLIHKSGNYWLRFIEHKFLISLFSHFVLHIYFKDHVL